MQPDPIEPEPASPFARRPAALVAGYLFWVLLVFVVDGAGRRICHVPTRAWIESGANAQERALRGFTYDKSQECLGDIVWYSYAMAVMTVVGLVAPFVIVGLFAKRILRAGLRFPIDNITATAVLFGFAFILALVLSMGPFWALDWVYDRTIRAVTGN